MRKRRKIWKGGGGGGGSGGLVVIFTPVLHAGTRRTVAQDDADVKEANSGMKTGCEAKANVARHPNRCTPPTMSAAEGGYRSMWPEPVSGRLAHRKLYAKFEILPRASANKLHESMVVTDAKVLSQFKYRLTGKKKEKLKKKYPIISGYILEHYLRYGKPPFRNFGRQRDIKWCRYGD